MPRRLLFALLVLVAAPLALLGWLSASTYRQQQETARERLELIFQSRLAEIDRDLSYIFLAYSRDLEIAINESDDTVQALRRLEQENPVVRASFYVNNSGVLVYPPKPTADVSDQIALHASLPAIIGSKPDLTSAADDPITESPVTESPVTESPVTESPVTESPVTESPVTESPASKRGGDGAAKSLSKSVTGKGYSAKSPVSKSASKPSVPSKTSASQSLHAPRGDGRWQVWYMDEGMQLIYWMPSSKGAAIGVLLERARWVSDLTAALPDSTPIRTKVGSTVQGSGFTTLNDESKRIVYRWGDDGKVAGRPLATHRLSAPLTSWQLQYHSADPLPDSASPALFASLAGIGVVLLSLGAYVLTGVQRQMRAARNRVSFASQVSHELRTPLTNIRLYAELAESDLEKLPASDPRTSIERRLEVIDTESRRLGRLVSGVLEMIRDNRNQQGPRIAVAVPDEVIEQTLKQFAPSFQNADLSVRRELDAGRAVGLDADILEMILVNLLSNVEKYASDGQSVLVSSRMDGSQLVIRVADNGPGIPWRNRRSIFRPFSRLDDSISAPSGTGIGLTIAERLAQRHGGRLELVSSQSGACFELRLPTQSAEGQYADTHSGPFPVAATTKIHSSSPGSPKEASADPKEDSER